MLKKKDVRKKINKHWNIGRRTEKCTRANGNRTGRATSDECKPNGTRCGTEIRSATAAAMSLRMCRPRRRRPAVGGARTPANHDAPPLPTAAPRRQSIIIFLFLCSSSSLPFHATPPPPPPHYSRDSPISPPSLGRRRDNYSLFKFFFLERTLIIQRCRVLWFYGCGYTPKRVVIAQFVSVVADNAVLCRAAVVVVVVPEAHANDHAVSACTRFGTVTFFRRA